MTSGAMEAWGGSSAAVEALGGDDGLREGDGATPANFSSLTAYYAKSSSF
jgi:hypothetical protein